MKSWPYSRLPILLLGLSGCGPQESLDSSPADVQDTLGCRAQPLAENRDRLVLVQTPYDQDAAASTSWQALLLDESGTLDTLERPFELGRAPRGNAVFTPDASMAFVAQEDGSIGILSFDENHEITVENPAFGGEFYASRLTVDPSGEVLWIVDPNWPENGGGIYRSEIDCSANTLSTPEKIFSSKNASSLILLPMDDPEKREAILIGREAAGSSSSSEAVLVDLLAPDAPAVEGELFGDEEAIASDAVHLAGTDFTLVADFAAFSSAPNRVAVVDHSATSLRTLQVLEPLLDPVDLVASAFGDQVLVLSGYGDAIIPLVIQDSDTAPFAIGPEPTTVNGSPQLPTAADQVAVGDLKGLVLVSENQGIRLLQLGEQASIEEVGFFSIGESFKGIAGAIGIAP
ncbi:MAG: hypothetical protein VXW32_08090 [Myxococcota bacterium]|nr:hypothetical protein [Myxococcota bacterium]